MKSAVERPAASRPPRQQVHHPTAADVLAAAPAVRQDGGVGAAGVLQRVGEDGQVGEAPPVVDGRRRLGDRAAVPRQPRRIDGGRGAEGVPTTQ
jgi:hypothetical protein